MPILKRVTGASAGTAEAINFNAQYVQTDATVAAGTANSMVTLALEYDSPGPVGRLPCSGIGTTAP